MTRSQLNVVIDPKLIEKLRIQSRKDGVTLSRYVSQVLSKNLNHSKGLSLEERIENLEEQVLKLTSRKKNRNIVSKTSNKKAFTRSYADDGAKSYGQLLKNEFHRIGEELCLSKASAWALFNQQKSFKNATRIDSSISAIFKKVLLGNHILKGKEIQDFIKTFKECPCKKGLEEMSGKIIRDLEFALNDAEEYED